ncbi:MAG: peptidoglycan -binding protein [Paracoccaceae bacterium]
MALSGRSSQRFSTAIWPGYVDALSTLLLVLTFVLTIFMVVQFALRDRITTQDTELDELTSQVAGLADALGLERAKSAGLSDDLAAAGKAADAQSALIVTLTAQLATSEGALTEARAKITSFEAQVASLLSERDTARADATALAADKEQLLTDKQALDLALATARTEIDAQTEQARLAAARREALEALLTDLRGRNSTADVALDEAEAAKLADAAAAQALREKLANAETELTAMTLALEEKRKEAEETLTLLAAAEAARKQLEQGSGDALTEAEKRAALLATAEAALAQEKQVSAESQRQVALLNEQVTALRAQLGSLQALLDEASERDSQAQVQIDTLGSDLNAALAQVASEQRIRAELEAAERARLEAEAAALKDEAKELARYRSDFFGKLSQVLEGREGVRVVGDRFVFSSEVLFNPASAELAPEGRVQIARVAEILSGVAGEIPPEIDWIIRVDGHTDAIPLSGTGRFRDNWELSQARALSVVRYMTDDLGFDPKRLAATGFGEYRPVVAGDTPDALAANRRIELKLTER